jgi:hypothetical protein
MNPRQRDYPPQAPSNSTPIGYAQPSTPRVTWSRFDIAMLVCAGIQLAAANYLCLTWAQGTRGSYELAIFRIPHQPPDATGLVIRTAWNVSQYDEWTIYAWAFGSAILIIAALSASPMRRRRLYRAFGIGWMLCLAAVLSADWALDYATVSYRRLIGQPPVPDDSWKMFVFEPSWLWEFPIMFVIVNPAIILLAWRSLGKLIREDGRI